MSTSSIVGGERSQLVEIDGGSEIRAVTFAPNGEYLVGGGDGVRIWRVEDGERIAAMEAPGVTVVAVSKNNRWIAAGTAWGEVIVWNATTHEKVLSHKEPRGYALGVDFAPDSNRLVVASQNCSATIWNFAAHKRELTLDHEDWVVAAKYSPPGDRIAAATPKSVRLWDGNTGRLLLHIPVAVTPLYNTGLVWAKEHLWILSDGKIKQLEVSSGSLVSEWPASSDETSCIALPKRGEFFAHSTSDTATLWETSTHTQLGRVQHPQDIFSVALSADDLFLAIGGDGGKITIKSLARITDSIPLSRLHPTFQEPDVQIADVALELWKNGQLENAEKLFSAAISGSQHPSQHVLASRALVRVRLRQWDTAIADAEKAISIQPSVAAYIAKSIAHVGKGEKDKGYRACDIAFERFHSTHVSFLLLVKAVIVFMAGEHRDAISRMDDLIATVHFNSICYIVQKAHMYLLVGNLHMKSHDYESAIQSFERARGQLRHHTSRSLLMISLVFGWKFDDLEITIRQRLCEALYTAGRIKDAGEYFLKVVHIFDDEVFADEAIVKWASNFACQCLSAHGGHPSPNVTRRAKALIPHATPSSSSPTPLLREWAKLKLTHDSWKDALASAVGFTFPRFIVYRVVCERLETIDRITAAADCFNGMVDELAKDVQNREAKWILEFKTRCCRKLEDVGDTAMNTEQYDEAVSQYSAALSLNPAAPQDLCIKRSKAYIVQGLWKAALDDANQVIKLDPSSPWGHERKHAALHQAGDYENAINAFEGMLSRMSQSSDPEILERHRQYTNPGETRVAIRRTVQDAIRDAPRVLINTLSGRLLDKSEQAAAFESLPVFNKLVSSMTTYIDHARIEEEVMEYYRYAMFSHKWEENEPLFDQVIRIVVYDLDESITHDKLRTFCRIAQDSGLHWAWSDTCCINKADHFVLQEALVAMFKWYQGSAVTIVLLRGVPSPSRRGDLVRSIWNTRAWTFQEYHASKVVRFYNEDWTLYMNLDIPNHKESPEILSEMEEAAGISARALLALRPGLDSIREKLCLASTRQTTLIEDAAYSLLGVFSISLPVVYGEGDQSLGRLLAQLLTSSGDTSILAWNGKSGSFNSCLPTRIAVFSQLPTLYIPPPVTVATIETTTTRSRTPSVNLPSATKLYDRLDQLPVPLFAGKRMKLPCITFKLGPLSISSDGPGWVFRAQTDAVGVVEIRTEEDLSRLHSLYLVHPWIDYLLDRRPLGSIDHAAPQENTDDQSVSIGESPNSSNLALANLPSRTARIFPRFGLSFGGWTAPRARDTSLQAPTFLSQADKQMRALRFIARLKQPFGALLLTPDLGNVAAYRRVATESLITVQLEESTSVVLNKLMDNVRVLDVL